jgi:hypothetical protein
VTSRLESELKPRRDFCLTSRISFLTISISLFHAHPSFRFCKSLEPQSEAAMDTYNKFLAENVLTEDKVVWIIFFAQRYS